jgi:hypothetical protein
VEEGDGAALQHHVHMRIAREHAAFRPFIVSLTR